jgi:hypothetical protein
MNSKTKNFPKPDNSPAIPQEDSIVACSFVATLDVPADSITVKALVSSQDRDVQLRLIMAVARASIPEIAKYMDASSCARFLTNALINAFQNIDPDVADSLRNIKKQALPNLSN